MSSNENTENTENTEDIENQAFFEGENCSSIKIGGLLIENPRKTTGRFKVTIEWVDEKNEEPTTIPCWKDVYVEIHGSCKRAEIKNGKIIVNGKVENAIAQNKSEITVYGDTQSCQTENGKLFISGKLIKNQK